MRSPELVEAGREVRTYKMALDCVSRMAPPTPKLEENADQLAIDLGELMAKSREELLRDVERKRQELWEAQKTCEPDMVHWINTELKPKAKAAGDKEWVRGANKMVKTARDRAVNRKLKAVTKGRHLALDRIQIPTHKWYHSKKSDEI